MPLANVLPVPVRESVPINVLCDVDASQELKLFEMLASNEPVAEPNVSWAEQPE